MLRIYTDTSVIGGCLDAEFADESRRLFDLARQGVIRLLISAVVISELENAPPDVQKVLMDLPEEALEVVHLTPKIDQLAQAYLHAGIVGPKWYGDATHVAAATIACADAIVSWNFKHIVRLQRIKRYNEVNHRLGYGSLTIITPMEVGYGNHDEPWKI